MTQTVLHVKWLSPADLIKAQSDFAATAMTTGEDWERSGAKFSTIDDGEGEMVRSASGVCATSVGGIAFRVWDYGDEPVTYLLVEGELSERPALAELVVTQMRRAGVLDDDVEVAFFVNHGAQREAPARDKKPAELEYLLEGAPAVRLREAQVYERTWSAQRRELLIEAARDLIALPAAVLVTLGLAISSGFSHWTLPLVPRIGLGLAVAIPLLVSIVRLLRHSLFRAALASSPTSRSRRRRLTGSSRHESREDLA